MILVKSEGHQSTQLSKQIKSELIEINQNNQEGRVLFKIFGQKQFSFESAYGKSVSDWSAFYTQLNPQHSMRYLTKKWSDGSEYACLIKISPNFVKKDKNLKLIKVFHSCLSNYSISGQQKAKLIKRHLNQKYKITFQTNDNKQKPLMKRLGQLNTLLSCIDSQDQQIIIPHDLLNKEYFQFNGLVKFKRSNDGMLRTIGWRPYKTLSLNQIWNKVYGQQQFQPYLLLKTNQEIKQIIKQFK